MPCHDKKSAPDQKSSGTGLALLRYCTANLHDTGNSYAKTHHRGSDKYAPNRANGGGKINQNGSLRWAEQA